MGHDLGREARGNGQPAVDDCLTASPDLPHRVLPHVTLLSDGEMPRRDTALSNAPPRAAVKDGGADAAGSSDARCPHAWRTTLLPGAARGPGSARARPPVPAAPRCDSAAPPTSCAGVSRLPPRAGRRHRGD